MFLLCFKFEAADTPMLQDVLHAVVATIRRKSQSLAAVALDSHIVGRFPASRPQPDVRTAMVAKRHELPKSVLLASSLETCTSNGFARTSGAGRARRTLLAMITNGQLRPVLGAGCGGTECELVVEQLLDEHELPLLLRPTRPVGRAGRAPRRSLCNSLWRASPCLDDRAPQEREPLNISDCSAADSSATFG